MMVNYSMSSGLKWKCNVCKKEPLDEEYLVKQKDIWNDLVLNDMLFEEWVFCKKCDKKAHTKCVFKTPGTPIKVREQFVCKDCQLILLVEYARYLVINYRNYML